MRSENSRSKSFSVTVPLLVGCREQLRKKDTVFDSKVWESMKRMKKITIVLKCKKMFRF